MVKFYVTTPIYYTNDVPHIGHAYTTIAADILAKYYSLKKYDVFFLTGTDEHGKKVELAAQKANKTPKEFVDALIPKFKDAWKKLDIDYDRFIRTTDKNHEKAVNEILKIVYDKGDIYKGSYEGYYCTSCESYYTEKDLIGGCCPIHKTKIEILSEETYFFKLSKYQNALLNLYKKNPQFISPRGKRQEVINRVKEGLQDLSISRTSFSWGIKLPFDKKHVCYVWFDALTNYLTGVGWPNKKYTKYWPADVHLVGKDILWFHSVIWPAMLISAGIKTPKIVFAHGWWTFDKEKISKSRGKVLNIDELISIAGVDAARYFLFRETPFGEDGDFSEKALIERYNSELRNELGNLLSRGITLVQKNGPVPPGKFELDSIAKKTIISVDKNISNLEFNLALNNIWNFIRKVNKYIQDKKPWETPKNLKNILYTIAESLRIIAYLTYPFIPKSSNEIAKQLGIKDTTKKLKPGTKVKKGKILFDKVDYSEKDPFSNLDIRVAEIKLVEEIPNADKLIKLKLNDRQIVAGIKRYYSKEELTGKRIIVVCNLKPAKLCGELSQGMLLAASKDDKVEVIFTKAKVGENVIPGNIKLNPVKEINIEDFIKIKMKTDDNGNVVYGKNKLMAGKEYLKVSLKNANIR